VLDVVRRLGPVQLAIITLLTHGAKEFNEIVETLTSMSIPKSSIYTAINELRRRGVVDVEVVGGRRIIKPKVDLKNELLRIKDELRDRALNVLTMIINLLSSDLISYDDLDPIVLERYRDVLKNELRKVEEVLRKWKSVEIS